MVQGLPENPVITLVLPNPGATEHLLLCQHAPAVHNHTANLAGLDACGSTHQRLQKQAAHAFSDRIYWACGK
jgi:hypothetical protein